MVDGHDTNITLINQGCLSNFFGSITNQPFQNTDIFTLAGKAIKNGTSMTRLMTRKRSMSENDVAKAATS